MGWRTLHIAQPARLSLRHDSLVLDNGEEYTIPLSDLSCIVIETRQATLTSPLIDALAECGAVTYICDEKHLPSSVLLPFHAHSRQAGVARMQALWSEPFKKRCWQRIIKAKVANQAKVISERSPKTLEFLRRLGTHIASGDSGNIEAQAARAYWSALFEDFARRTNENDIRNSALNYGYAIVRGMVARALVGVGFLPAFGLHHCSELNAFNLADDLIEPFRPFVDAVVRELLDEDGEELPFQLDMRYKTRLLELITMPCRFGTIETTLPYACELSAESLLRASRGKDPSLIETVSFA
ncbi:MAG: type II CRISPR-associated endonuclease Cas1 [Campylobacterales bacterium]|nr:type II CRISPR-associated endonuclease Cas1 [Campylobacterales bacterium]